ncbi:MAG: dUTP diphosphatase [Thermoanaerobaculia bacterium]
MSTTPPAPHPPPLEVRIRRLPHAEGLPLPGAATPGSAGADLRAAVADDVVIEVGERRLIPTGWSVEIPSGWEGQVRPRSGLAAKFGVTLLNAPGTIDSDYRGEIQVLLVHLGAPGSAPFVVRRGERIAQLVISPVPAVRFVEAEELPGSERGSGGFGSTGSS